MEPIGVKESGVLGNNAECPADCGPPSDSLGNCATEEQAELELVMTMPRVILGSII